MKHNQIVYVSNMCTEEKLEKLFEGDYKGLPQQIQRYHRLLAGGLASREGMHVDALSALPITRGNCTKKKIEKEQEKKNQINYHYLSTKNSPLLKRMGDFFGGFFHVMKFQRKNSILVVDILDAAVVMGALFASKLKGIKAVGIVTDIPDFLFVIGKMHRKLANININLCNSYILLTEQMNEVINQDYKKPYIVMEGHVPSMSEKNIYEKYEKDVCFYAGILDERYGVKYLVEGFVDANISNTELHLYGEGKYKDDLIKYSKAHQNVLYKGVKPNKEIVLEEHKAALLINPRPSKEEFVKYSFPSKNLEYMVSGTPVLTTILPGMPKEYEKYVYKIKDETKEGISEALKDIFSRSKSEREEFGAKGKRYVLENKSADAQAKRICDFLEKIYG